MKYVNQHWPAMLVLLSGLAVRQLGAQVTLFSDDFTTDTSGNWSVKGASATAGDDYTVNFGFNYATNQFVRNGVTNTIPLAPNSTVGVATNGVKITVNNNDETPDAAAVNLFPILGSTFSNDFALKFDMFISYNGPEFGGSGSTEFGIFGVNMSGDNVNWGVSATVPGDGIWFAVASEGGAARDYRTYVGDNLFPGSLELQASSGGMLDRDGDTIPEQDILINASQPPTYPLILMFPQPTYETRGIASKRWVEVEVRQRTNELGGHVITWLINGYVIAQKSFDEFGWVSGNVMLGYMDPLASIANPREQNFIIYDNVRVVDLSGVVATPVVSITPTQPAAAEPGTDGVITISRTGDTTAPLTVDFRLTGTATRGADYTTETNGVTFTGDSVVIPAGASSVGVTINVLDDGIGEPVETVIMVLAGKANVYDVAESLSARVEITDDGDLPTVTVAATKAFTYEPNAASPARLEVRLSNPTFQNVTVSLAVSGTASSGVDFTSLPTSVIINAGETNAVISVAPINNSNIDGDRTVILTVTPGTGYNVGNPAAATATIRDDDSLPTGVSLFTENFDALDSGNNWQVNAQGGRLDHTATFAYDYSLDGIPRAPNSTGTTTSGLKLTANESGGAFGGLSASPLGQGFTGDYIFRFDMWINYNGPLPTGGAGSSEFGGGGIATTGTAPEFGGSGNGLFFAAVGDGAFLQDFRVYLRGAIQNIPTAANVTFPGGSQNNNAPYYAIFGNEVAPVAQQAADPVGQAGATGLGNAGFAWRDMAIVKQGTTVRWYMDSLHIATFDTTTNVLSTNICLLYWDPNNGVSPQPQFSFGVFDNVRVQALESVVTTPPDITSIAIVAGNVQIDFTAETSDTPAAFELVASATVNGLYEAVPATITQLSPGNFRALRAVNGNQQFYRIRRQ